MFNLKILSQFFADKFHVNVRSISVTMASGQMPRNFVSRIMGRHPLMYRPQNGIWITREALLSEAGFEKIFWTQNWVRRSNLFCRWFCFWLGQAGCISVAAWTHLKFSVQKEDESWSFQSIPLYLLIKIINFKRGGRRICLGTCKFLLTFRPEKRNLKAHVVSVSVP